MYRAPLLMRLCLIERDTQQLTEERRRAVIAGTSDRELMLLALEARAIKRSLL